MNRSLKLGILTTDSTESKLNFEIQCTDKATGKKFENDPHILYVNGTCYGNMPIEKLRHDFSCTDAANMYYGTLAEQVRFFKEGKKEIAIMCRAMEDSGTSH